MVAGRICRAILIAIAVLSIPAASDAQEHKQVSRFTGAWLSLMQWTRVNAASSSNATVERWTFSPDSTAVHWTTDASPACLVATSSPGCILRNGREAWFRWTAYIAGGKSQVCLTAINHPSDDFGVAKPRPRLIEGEAGCHWVRFFNNQGVPEASAFLELDGDPRRFQSIVPVPTIDCHGEAIPASTTDFEPRCSTPAAKKAQLPVSVYPTVAKALASRPRPDTLLEERRRVHLVRVTELLLPGGTSCNAACPRTIGAVLATKQQDSLRALVLGTWEDTSNSYNGLQLYLHGKGVGALTSNMDDALTMYWYVLPWEKSPGSFLFCEVDQELVGYKTPTDSPVFVPPTFDASVRCYVSKITHRSNSRDELAIGNRAEWPRLTRAPK